MKRPLRPLGLRWLLSVGLTLPALAAQQALPPPPDQAQWSRYLCVGLLDGSVLGVCRTWPLGGLHRPIRSGFFGAFLHIPPVCAANSPKNRPRLGRESHPRSKPDRLLVYTWWDLLQPTVSGRAGRAGRRVSGNAWCFTPTHALIGQQIRSVPLDSVRYAMTDTPERLPGVPTLQPRNNTALGTGMTILGATWLILLVVLFIAMINLIGAIAGVGF